MIKSWMYRKPGSSVRKCAKALNESKRFLGKDKKLSHQTVQNFIKTTTWGKTAFKSSCKPHLSAKNISDRVRFGTFRTGNRYLTDGRRGHEKRSNILFTDELVRMRHGLNFALSLITRIYAIELKKGRMSLPL